MSESLSAAAASPAETPVSPAPNGTQPPLMELQHVDLTYGGKVRAVVDASLSVPRGTTFGLVGESGSGKSTLARVMVGLYQPTAGTVLFKGDPMSRFDARAKKAFKRAAQKIFQDPVASLSPRLKIKDLLEEPLIIHKVDRAEAWPNVLKLLHRVGLSETVLEKYPHQVSGGQARRVGICRALVLNPDLVVADEPTAGLDVSVQGDLINLMGDLQRDFGLTYVMVSHNLHVIRAISDRLGVMYLGRLVETGPTRAVFQSPAHPYTRALIEATPTVTAKQIGIRQGLQGEIPSLLNPPPGCPFQTRCPIVEDRCRIEVPKTRRIAPDREVICHKPLV